MKISFHDFQLSGKHLPNDLFSQTEITNKKFKTKLLLHAEHE